jgi:hypothetical protein
MQDQHLFKGPFSIPFNIIELGDFTKNVFGNMHTSAKKKKKTVP